PTPIPALHPFPTRRSSDLDFERSTEEMVGGILDGMRLLGLDWDEGPFYQSKRMDLYKQNAERLIKSGHGYYCFCTKEQLEKRRADRKSTRLNSSHDQISYA